MTRFPRLAFFTYNGVVWPLVVATPGDAMFWTLWVALHFVWPHIAYLLSRVSPEPRRAEGLMLAGEAFVVGFTINELDYLPWYAFSALAAVGTAAVSLGGLRQLGRSFASAAAGTGIWGMVRGFELTTLGPLPIELAGAVGGAIPLLLVTQTTYRAGRQLRQARRTIERKNRVLEHLLQMGIATHQATDVDEILSQSLDQLRELMPQLGFGIVLHEPGRVRVIRHAAFRGMPEASREPLLEALRRCPEDSTQRLTLQVSGGEDMFTVYPLTAHLSQLRGVLVAQGPVDEGDAATSIRLFLDQVASALESSLLTSRLEQLANTDALTGLYNRTYFNGAHARAIRNRRGAAGVDFSLLVLDVNDLKSVNDRYGHEVGDRVIVAAARLLAGVTRESDVLVRMGGDEFVILAHACGSRELATLIERIRRVMETGTVRASRPGSGEVTLPVRLSLGAASSDEVPAENVLRTADSRMYEDKASHYRGATRPR